MKEFGTVSKIYFILKISEGKLEALRMSTEAPCYIFSLHSRYHLETFLLYRSVSAGPKKTAEIFKALHSERICFMPLTIQS